MGVADGCEGNRELRRDGPVEDAGALGRRPVDEILPVGLQEVEEERAQPDVVAPARAASSPWSMSARRTSFAAVSYTHLTLPTKRIV